MIGLDEETLKRIEEDLERDFAPVRERIQKALNKVPKLITFKEAQEQINKFKYEHKH